jgi:nicotinate-nucleotide--dimethylbenzimidazole phosphoribosyltransferase
MSANTQNAELAELTELIQQKIDNKTKPRGALGDMETLAMRLCLIQQTLEPVLDKPTIIVFAADHGIAHEAVSAYPREVSAQMALNIAAGGAGINAFSRQNGIEVLLVDAGIDWPEGMKPDGMIDHWMGAGTASYLGGDAMSAETVQACLAAGADVVDNNVDPACTIIGFGELGISNTSSASLLMNALTGIDLIDCIGPGTGLIGEGLAKKIEILSEVKASHALPADAFAALAMFGGFEITQMVGAMLRSYETGRILMIDGFVASAAFLCASKIEPGVLDSAVFCHQSGEPGHARLLNYLGAAPLLHLSMRLGEGTGCAVAYPIIQSALAFLRDMASFDEAGVSTGDPEA